MNATEFKRIRHKLGLSLSEMATALRISSTRNIAQYEDGSRDVTGPVSLLMEHFDRGDIRPQAGDAT